QEQRGAASQYPCSVPQTVRSSGFHISLLSHRNSPFSFCVVFVFLSLFAETTRVATWPVQSLLAVAIEQRPVDGDLFAFTPCDLALDPAAAYRHANYDHRPNIGISRRILVGARTCQALFDKSLFFLQLLASPAVVARRAYGRRRYVSSTRRAAG